MSRGLIGTELFLFHIYIYHRLTNCELSDDERTMAFVTELIKSARMLEQLELWYVTLSPTLSCECVYTMPSGISCQHFTFLIHCIIDNCDYHGIIMQGEPLHTRWNEAIGAGSEREKLNRRYGSTAV